MFYDKNEAHTPLERMQSLRKCMAGWHECTTKGTVWERRFKKMDDASQKVVDQQFTKNENDESEVDQQFTHNQNDESEDGDIKEQDHGPLRFNDNVKMQMLEDVERAGGF